MNRIVTWISGFFLLALAGQAQVGEVFIAGSSHTGPSPLIALAGVDGPKSKASWLYATNSGELRLTRSKNFPNDFMGAGILLDPDIGPVTEATINGPLKLSLEVNPLTGLHVAAWRRVRDAGTLLQTGELVVGREQADGSWQIDVVDSVVEGLAPTTRMVAQSTDLLFHPQDEIWLVFYQRGGDLYCAFENTPGGNFSAIPIHQSGGHSGNSVDAAFLSNNQFLIYHQDSILGDIVRTQWNHETITHDLLGPSPPTKVRAQRISSGQVAVVYEAEASNPLEVDSIELLLDNGLEWTRQPVSNLIEFPFEVHDLHLIERTKELLILFRGPHLGIDDDNPPGYPVLVTFNPETNGIFRVELAEGAAMNRPVLVSDPEEATPKIGYIDNAGSLRTRVDEFFAPKARGGLPYGLEVFFGLNPGELLTSANLAVSNPTGLEAQILLKRVSVFAPLDAQTFKLQLGRTDLHAMLEFSYGMESDAWSTRGLNVGASSLFGGMTETTFTIDGEPEYADSNPPRVFARARLSRAPTPD
jgi:hypothetical protein